MTLGTLRLIRYIGRHIYSWPNSVNKITEHYKANALRSRLFSAQHITFNYVSQQQCIALSSYAARNLAIRAA